MSRRSYFINKSSFNTPLGEYTFISGGFSGSGATYFSGLVGHGANSPDDTTNYYSSGSSNIAYFSYKIKDVDKIPDNATITEFYVTVKGKCESNSAANEYMCVQLMYGDTPYSEEFNFKNAGSTNVTTHVLHATDMPTVEMLKQMVLRCKLGYYGGNIAGATFHIEFM